MVGKGENGTRMNTEFLDDKLNLRMEINPCQMEVCGGWCHNIYFWEAYAVNLKMVFNLLNNFSGNPLQDGDRVYGLAAWQMMQKQSSFKNVYHLMNAWNLAHTHAHAHADTQIWFHSTWNSLQGDQNNACTNLNWKLDLTKHFWCGNILILYLWWDDDYSIILEYLHT